MRATCKFVFASIVLIYTVPAADPHNYMFVKVKKVDDTVDDPVIKKVYDGALNLLVYKMKTWMKSVAAEDSDAAVVETISEYLGFPYETIQVIDVAFTELAYRHVLTKNTKINNLGVAFFYSCDIGHMHSGDANSVVNVRKNFEMILRNLEIAGDDSDAEVDVRGEQALVDDLKESVNAIEKPVGRWYRVSIGLEKNWLFVNPESENATVKSLWRRFFKDYQNRLSVIYETETNVLPVMTNHVRILLCVIPDLFGFAYDHVLLLAELRHFDIEDLDDSNTPVLHSVQVLPLVVAIFLNRYVEMLASDDYIPIRRDIFRFLDFFDPTQIYPEREVSIAEYKNKDPDDSFKRRMMDAANWGIKQMLRYFTNETFESWKKSRTILLQHTMDKTNDRDEILKLMAVNTGYAKEFLAEIKRHCGLHEDPDDDGEYARLRESSTVPKG